MSAPHQQQDTFELLRKKAESLVRQSAGDAIEYPNDIIELVQELEIRQKELEIQNEELQRAQAELSTLHRESDRLYEFAPCGYLTINKKGIIARVNLTGTMLLGKARKILTRTSFSQYISPHWDQFYIAAIQKAGQTGEKQTFDLPLKRDNGHRFWVRAEIGVDRDETGEVNQWWMILIDIDKSKRLEKALKDSEEKYRRLFQTEKGELQNILDSIPALIFYKDTQNRILKDNHYFAETTGLKKKDLEGRSVEEIAIDKDIASANWHDDLEVLNSGKAKRNIIEPLITDKNRWFRTDKIPHLDMYGEINGLIGFSFEITEHLRAEEDSRLLRENLAHLDRVTMMGEFAASLAHEINQPLTAIMSNAEAARHFLRKDPPNLEEVSDILNDIISDDERAGKVIKRLRRVFKKSSLELTNVDLTPVIEESISIVKSELILRNIAIRKDLDKNIKTVFGDRVQLQQVILNLILNALEAMRTTAIDSRRITFATCIIDPQTARVSIEDSGPGIPQKKLDRIFQPFFTTRKEGIGMGLSINRSIIEAQGGRIWAENITDGGARFNFTIPLHNAGIE